MKLTKNISSIIVYNYSVKKPLSFLLGALSKNPLYYQFYKQLMAWKMKGCSLVPKRVMIENTNLCSANCFFCPHKTMKRKIGIMKMGLYRKIVDECSRLEVEQVTLHGFGEPLMDKDFIERVKYAKDKGIPKVITNTNGMFLDSDKIKRIFESGLDEIYISFDAATPGTYQKIRPGLDYFGVKRNLLALLKEKKRQKNSALKVFLSFVENPLNQKETRVYLKKWKNLVNGISVSFIHNWAGKIESNLIKARKDPCRLLWTDLVVSWNGEVPLCCNDFENKIVLGNLNRQSILDVWRGKRLELIREKHKKYLFEKLDLCKNCQSNWHCRLPWWGV